MSYYDEIKKELEENPDKKTEFKAMIVPTFDEFWYGNKDELENYRKKKKPFRIYPRIIPLVASIILIIGLSLGLGLYFGLKGGDTPIEYRYEDDNIAFKEDVNDSLHNSDIYLPNLDLLDQIVIAVGEHKETLESVYFTIEGIYDNNEKYRKIKLTIILQPKYTIKGEKDYNTDDKEKIGEYNISILDNGYDDPLYRYKLGFKIDKVRYYIDYETIEENDVSDFLTEFLK